MVAFGHRLRPDGTYGLAYDPAIAVNVKMAVQDWNLWALWDKVVAPTLVLRGADSDLLTAETAAEMTQRGPKAHLVTWAGMGHAPALLTAEQIDQIKEWLTGR